ncbi:hypothetical protein F5Y18DRAFT_119367 [Xylariaceae sp. FL1019]|nr:hypothetical protein F5Y18DRAFT_119367 [Xylariaceae sp. FL1019]
MRYSILATALVGATTVHGLPSFISEIVTDFKGALAPLLQPISYGHHLVNLEEAKTKYAAWPKFVHPDPQHEYKDGACEAEIAFKNGSLGGLLPRETAAACAASPNIRFEWDDYSTSDRQALMSAFKCLQNKAPSGAFSSSTSRWEDFARLHQSYTTNIHGNQKFLLWHRYFLWTFEQVLRDECGFNRAFVWFDETKHAGAFSGSDLFSSAYLGTLSGAQKCVTDGAFAGLTCHIGPGTGESTHCLSRKGTSSDTAQCSTGYINYCASMADYQNYEVCLENGPHGYGHNGVGGVMEDVNSSPQEPFFWFHHAFIDRAYRVWELANTGSRYTSIDGVDHNGNAITLDTVIFMGGIRPDVTVREIINTLSGTTMCYRYNY